MFKAFGEILESRDLWNMPIMSFTILVAGLIGALVQIFFLNLAMKYYNNLDIMPVYQSLILIMMLVTAWILLDEISYYSMNRILGIVASSVLIIIGIKIITSKTVVVAQKKKKKRHSEQPILDDPLLQSNGPANSIIDPEESDTDTLNASRLTFESRHSNVFMSESDMSGETLDDKREKQRETAIAEIVKVMLGRENVEPVIENIKSAKNSSAKKFNLEDS